MKICLKDLSNNKPKILKIQKITVKTMIIWTKVIFQWKFNINFNYNKKEIEIEDIRQNIII